MTISADYIEQIVRNVMREMQARVAPVDAVTSVGIHSTLGVVEADTLRISSRVVSENILLEAQASGRTISIEPGAIITPSGRDYIRRNNIRVSSQIGGKRAEATWGTLITVGPNPVVQSAAATAGWRTLTASAEPKAALLASENLTKGMVVCCGGEPSVVACLLNRNHTVRAAVVTRATNLVTLSSVMNPQVVCLESAAWSFGDVLKLLRGFSATGSETVPTGWRELAAGGIR
jgi:hypothetical protein